MDDKDLIKKMKRNLRKGMRMKQRECQYLTVYFYIHWPEREEMIVVGKSR